jgi:hypothetical protein
VVGASPPILATAFVSLLLTWALFIFLGVEPSPGTLGLLVAVPPAQVLFSDAALVLGPESDGTAIALTVVGIAVLRGLTFGLMCLLVVQQLREGRTSVRQALRALPRTAVIVAGVYLIELAAVLAISLLVFRLVGEVALIFLVPAGLYFLAFALVVAAAEVDGPLPALRRGLRAARLPGTRHLSMVMAYFLILFYARTIAPFGILAPSTPSIEVWAYGLGLTFIHVSVLAAFAYRWLEVRDQVPAAAGPRER